MIIPIFGKLIVIFLLVCIEESTQEPKELSLGDPKLCSEITKRKVRYESLIVTQGLASEHSLRWLTPDICKFEVQSVYPKGGALAVIQKLHLRKNFTTGECIDYIQFRSKKGLSSQRYCGFLNARLSMNYDIENVPDSVYPQYYPISYSNSFIDVDGELDVIIYIAKQPLELNERTEFEVVFTSYRDCSEPYHMKHVTLRNCDENYSIKICINKNYFGDGYINCPHFDCLDEGGCILPILPAGKESIGNGVIVASLSVMFVLFGVFILAIWISRKFKLLCWAEEFAHPSSTPEDNRNSRIIELNEQTGARLAETESNSVEPSAPNPDEEKDLPPSYESLFPATATQS